MIDSSKEDRRPEDYYMQGAVLQVARLDKRSRWVAGT